MNLFSKFNIKIKCNLLKTYLFNGIVPGINQIILLSYLSFSFKKFL